MKYKIESRIELIVYCDDYIGTYEGFKCQSYYGIRVRFRDEDGRLLIWNTTDNAKQPPPTRGKYKIRATIKGFDEHYWVILSRVKILKKFRKDEFKL